MVDLGEMHRMKLLYIQYVYLGFFTFLKVLICLQCSHCVKFVQLILRKICHQMPDFKTEMQQIRFRLGLRPRPRWGAYSAPPDPLAPSWILGGLLLREGRREREGRRKGEEGDWKGSGRERGKGGWRKGEGKGCPYCVGQCPSSWLWLATRLK